MRIVAVDDEKSALRILEKAIREALPDAELACFLSSEECLSYINHTNVDVAFLDIKMRGIDGLSLAQQIQNTSHSANIIFVTAYSDYYKEAFDIYASGYIRKPVQAERIKKEVENLRQLPNHKKELNLVKAFGPYLFDHMARRLYLNGEDLLLTPKEFQIITLLANNSGNYFTTNEIYKKVWGESAFVSKRAVYRHISSLRIKMKIDHESKYDIILKREKGYRLERRD